MSTGNAVLSIAMGVGSVVGGGLVAWHPINDGEPLALPVLVALVVQIVALPVAFVLMREPHRANRQVGLAAALRGAPTVVGAGLRLLRRSRVLAALVVAEVLWSFGMPAFETLTPVRLSEILGDTTRAAAIIGPAGSAAWAASAIGSAAALWGTSRWGVARCAIALRLVQGSTVVVMGLMAGVAGLLTAFLACYLVHGASNSMHQTLLHRQVDSAQRATVVSINSMASQPAAAVGVLVLTASAEGRGTGVAFIVAGLIIAAAAPLYWPALRAERVGPSRRPRRPGGRHRAGDRTGLVR